MLWSMKQHSFGGGRLDKSLMGRQDIAAYFKGASELKNFVVTKQGSVRKRHSTVLVCDLYDVGVLSTAGYYPGYCRLVPIVYSKSLGYCILFFMYQLSDTYYVTVISREGVRRNCDKVKYDTSFSDEDSYFVDTGIPTSCDLNYMDYFQSGDKIFITHPGFAPKEIEFLSSEKKLSIKTIDFGTDTSANAEPTVSSIAWDGKSGSAYYYYVVTAVYNSVETGPSQEAYVRTYSTTTWQSGKKVTLNITKGTRGDSAIPSKYKVYRAHTTKLDTSLKDHYYIGDALADATTGAATFTDAGTSEGATTPPDNASGCSITNCVKTPSSWDSQTGSDRDIKYAVCAVDSNGREGVTSPPYSVTYKMPWPNTGKMALTITKASGAKMPHHYNVYKNTGSGYGLIGIAEELDASGGATFEDDYITPDMTQTPITREGHFNAAGEYPRAVSMYQQRLMLGGTKNDPFTFYMSVTGDLCNFDTHESLRDDDAIEATLSAAEMPEINHIVMSRDLIVFTNGGEWEVAPVSGNAITYKTISAKMQSAIGSAKNTKPIVVKDEIVFCDATQQNIVATRYSYTSDGYESKDLTVMVRDLFVDNYVVRMCYRQLPDPEIICCMKNGELAVLSYMSEHDVCAWSRIVLGGGWLARDCASPKAVINGASETFILVCTPDLSHWEVWAMTDSDLVMDGWFDYTPAFDLPMISDTIAVNPYDGTVYKPGDTIPEGTQVMFGYSFESELVTVCPEPQGNDTIQMEVKNATEVEVRVVDSSSFSIGANDGASMRRVELPVSVSLGNITLTTKDVRVPITGQNTRDGRIKIVHNDPFKFNLLSLNTTYQVEAANLNGSGGQQWLTA